MKRLSTYFYLLSLIGCLTLSTACSDSKEEEKRETENENENNGTSTEEKSDDEEVNKLSFAILSDYYLWNDEYKAQKLNYDLDYQSFFYNGLLSLKTNTLDKKPYTVTDEQGNVQTKYNLFSYITEVPDYATTRASDPYAKEKTMSYGLVGLLPYRYYNESDPNTKDYYVRFIVNGVYADSPAANAGLARGTLIEKFDGKYIRMSNRTDSYNALMAATTVETHTLQILTRQQDNTIGAPQTVTLSCNAIHLNPILKAQVEEVEGHKVGYLAYSSFEGSYDEELLNELKKFKSEGISDLVLDLRYNGGGHVASANLLSTAIAGEASKGKTFVEYRFNDSRMKKLGNKRESKAFGESLSKETLKNSLSQAMLNLNRLYVLVGEHTASASELVINSLKGIDIEVYLIGQTTTGKNVGMEVFRVGKGEKQGSDLQKTYEIAPITFQSYNAKGFGDYEKGFQPDLAVDKLNPFNEENTIRIYRPYGSQQEYLYGLALEQITGKTILERPTAQTRGLVSPIGEVIETLPAPQLGTRGMIIYPEE